MSRLLLFIMVLSLLTGCGQGTPKEAADERSAGEWIPLISEGMAAWHSYLGRDVKGWTVKDGILSTSGKNGDIVTDEEFENFELELDWKIGTGGNSGIFYYVIEDPNYERMYETGPEFQIIDIDNYPQELTEQQKTGSLSDVLAPTAAVAKPPGQWNHTRIIVTDGHAEHWLNGQQILSYQIGSADWDERVAASKFASLDYGKILKGRIGLQDHGNKVSFRDIKVRRL